MTSAALAVYAGGTGIAKSVIKLPRMELTWLCQWRCSEYVLFETKSWTFAKCLHYTTSGNATQSFTDNLRSLGKLAPEYHWHSVTAGDVLLKY